MDRPKSNPGFFTRLERQGHFRSFPPRGMSLIFLSLPFALGSLYFAWQRFELAEFNKHAVQTTGFVTAKEPHNHRSLRYKYNVDGEEYGGIGSPISWTSQEYNGIQLGQTITVFYSSARPGVSALEHPAKLIEGNTGPALASAALALFCIISGFATLKKP